MSDETFIPTLLVHSQIFRETFQIYYQRAGFFLEIESVIIIIKQSVWYDEQMDENDISKI